MTRDEQRLILQVIQSVLQDNLNNRITLAVGNGIITQVEQEIEKLVTQPETQNGPTENL